MNIQVFSIFPIIHHTIIKWKLCTHIYPYRIIFSREMIWGKIAWIKEVYLQILYILIDRAPGWFRPPLLFPGNIPVANTRLWSRLRLSQDLVFHLSF